MFFASHFYKIQFFVTDKYTKPTYDSKNNHTIITRDDSNIGKLATFYSALEINPFDNNYGLFRCGYLIVRSAPYNPFSEILENLKFIRTESFNIPTFDFLYGKLSEQDSFARMGITVDLYSHNPPLKQKVLK